MTAWHEQDAFWETFESKLFSQHVWEMAADEIDWLLGLVELAPGSAILDLACGPGRHALELARRGFRVTGVDRTAAYLDRARGRAEEEGLRAEWVQEDMRTFCRPESFDAAVNLYTAFGYFEDIADDRQVAENLVRSLKPGAPLVMEMMGKEILARIYHPRDWYEQADGTLMLEERIVRDGWDWMENRWIMIRGSERKEFRLAHRIYSAAELTQLLRDVGFATINVYGHLDGSPYDHSARRLVAVAHKGGESR